MNHELPDPTGPALCAATARLLRASAGTLASMGLALAALAAAALWWRAGTAGTAGTAGPADLAWGVVLLLTPLERLWAWRLHLDAGLFTDLAQTAAPMATNLAALDDALHTLGLRALPTAPRALAERVHGALRLALQHAVFVAVQTLAAAAALAVGGF